MKTTLLLQGFLISLLLNCLGCLHRAPSLRMLEERSGYEEDNQLGGKDNLALSVPSSALVDTDSKIPMRTRPRVSHIWIYPHDLGPSGYFWGGWLSIVTESDRWEFSSGSEDFAPLPPVETSAKKVKNPSKSLKTQPKKEEERTDSHEKK